jgi:nucleotide-binding universal stress UspA family protein
MATDHAPAGRRLIVGTSGSPGSLQALRYAEGLARTHGTMLIPVLAWQPPGGDRDEWIPASAELRRTCFELARQRLRDALLAVWGEVPCDPRVEPRVERGPAGRVLVSLACCPGDVLVIGAGRRARLARMALSGVSRYCLAHAQCPVLAVPPPALAGELRRARLPWVFWHRQLTPQQILGDQPRSPA